MKKLIGLFVTALSVSAVAVALPATASATVSCNTGLGWGYFYKTSTPSGTLSGNIEELADSTPTGTGTTGDWAHVIGRIGEQMQTVTSPQIQTGIWEEDGGAPRFYVEEAGVDMTGVSGWEQRWDGSTPVFEHFFGSPANNVLYHFSVVHTGGDSYYATAPGYTSPTFAFSSALNMSTYTNEISANSTTCPYGSYEFTSPSPWPFSGTNKLSYATQDQTGGQGNALYFIDSILSASEATIGFPNDQSCGSGPC